MAQPTGKQSLLPEIHLLCLLPSFAKDFNNAVTEYFPDLTDHVKVITHTGRLERLKGGLKLDAIVSPANSYGRLDGAFDDAISKMLSPDDDYDWVTRKAQAVLYKKWKGFAPPGTCTVIPLESEAETETVEGAVPIKGREKEELRWGCKYVMLCPTMRTPADVRWDREVIYNCIWSLLCSIQEHNESAQDDRKINSILMTPLATGVGRVSYPRWAGQCVLAMKHWIDASTDPEKWSSLEWGDIFPYHEETRKTYFEEI